MTEALDVQPGRVRAVELLRLFAVASADERRLGAGARKGRLSQEGVMRSAGVKYGEPRDQLLYRPHQPDWRGDGNPSPIREGILPTEEVAPDFGLDTGSHALDLGVGART